MSGGLAAPWFADWGRSRSL